MARKVFFSFHFDNDYWRTQQVRNINALEGNPIVTANAWEEVKKKGDAAVKAWIDNEMLGRSCAIVLVGSETATRKWVKYEIEKAWKDKKGVLGVRIHKLLDSSSKPSIAGSSPFSGLVGPALAPLKDPIGADSKAVYATIATNIETWIEEAITTRGKQP